MVEAGISAVCFLTIFVCNLIRALGNKYPHWAISTLIVEKQLWIMESIALIAVRRLKSKKFEFDKEIR